MQNNLQSNKVSTKAPLEGLSAFIESVAGDSIVRIEDNYGHGYVKLKTSEAELRQAAQDIKCVEDAVIELLRNSRDAGAKHIFLATNKEGTTRRLRIVDDACGIPESMYERIFDARVTSKLDTAHMDKWGMHGRGMALYSIAVNAEEAYVAYSQENKGSSIAVNFDTSKISEKTDQSTFPKFEKTDSGFSMRGPKNITRVAAEFAFECRDELEVYIGSPVEIVAAMYKVGCEKYSAAERIFSKASAKDASICDALAFIDSPEAGVSYVSKLGFDMSSRSVRRIIDGEIKPVDALAVMLIRNSFNKKNGEGGQSQSEAKGAISEPGQDLNIANGILSSIEAVNSTTLKLDFAHEDLSKFANDIKAAYGELAYKYYLSCDIEPKISQRNGELVIKIDLLKE
jgi:hypothetical protein